jgi:hypothetical protein
VIDWQFGILLLAIAVTWLAWRRARRQAELERARAAALAEPRWQYCLVPAGGEAGVGPGYRVETPDGQHIPDERLQWERHGLEVVSIGGATMEGAAEPLSSPGSLDALDPLDALEALEALEAGTGMQLVAAAQDGVIEVRDEAAARHVATLRGEVARAVADRLDSGELTDCIVLREPAGDESGGEWRLLLVHGDAAVDA